ncbi:hypothetical protein D3C81_2223240 [compost metagenome]
MHRFVQQRLQSEQTGRALDGVRRAKYGPQGIAVTRFVLQSQQRFFHILQQLAGFGDEGLQGLIEIYTHAEFLLR